MTSRRRLFGVPIAVVTVAIVVVMFAGSAGAAGATFAARINGANEAPGPGDPDGKGFASLTLDELGGTVCWSIAVRNILLPATFAHIHLGDPGVPGGIVVFLSPPDATGHASGCIEADPALIGAIKAGPQHYYVNVHNEEYPAGALRGQIRPVAP